MIHQSSQKALSLLNDGDIDAMFYVSGYPVKLIQDIKNTNLHLVPITSKKLVKAYRKSTIPKGTYSINNNFPIKTIAVKAIIMTFDYKHNDCTNVGNLAKIIYDNIVWLRANGHPKWQKVDLNRRMSTWQQYQCVTNKIPQILRN